MKLPYDFNWIIPDRLGAMSLPRGEDLTLLREAGVTLLVSLLRGHPSDEAVRRAGLRLLRLPVPDFGVPSGEQLREFVAEVRAELAAGGKVVVHCVGGLGRTGTFIAAYLISEGRGAQEAIDFVRRRRPGSVETAEQEGALHDWAGKGSGGGSTLCGPTCKRLGWQLRGV